MVHDLYLLRVKQPSELHSEWDLLQVLDTIPGQTIFPSLEEEQSCHLAH